MTKLIFQKTLWTCGTKWTVTRRSVASTEKTACSARIHTHARVEPADDTGPSTTGGWSLAAVTA